MLIYTHLLAALLAASAAWTVRAWKADADEAAVVKGLHAAVLAQQAAADKSAVQFEVERARLVRKRQVITQEVDRVVERPIYRDGVCLDADGLRLVAAAVDPAASAGEPAPALPAASAAGRR